MKTAKITYVAMFTALAVVIHYFEGLIPVPIPIPGFKLGLANIVGVFVLFYFGWPYYLACTAARVLLVALISTGFGTAFLLSLSGALLSTLASVTLFRLTKASIFSVSTVGAFFHVCGQILMYILITATPFLISYLPILAFLAMLSGFLLAFVAQALLRRLPKLNDYGYRKLK